MKIRSSFGENFFFFRSFLINSFSSTKFFILTKNLLLNKINSVDKMFFLLFIQIDGIAEDFLNQFRYFVRFQINEMKKKPEQRKRIGSPAFLSLHHSFTCNSSVFSSDNISVNKKIT